MDPVAQSAVAYLAQHLGPWVAVLLLSAWIAIRALALGARYLDQRKGHDTKTEEQNAALIKSVADLTLEIRKTNEGIALLAGRVERQEASIIAAIGADGTLTREHVDDRRASDLARATERVAAVAAHAAGVSVPDLAPELEQAAETSQATTGRQPSYARLRPVASQKDGAP